MPIDDRDMGREQVGQAHLTVRFGRPFHIDELEAETAGSEDPRQALTDAMMRRVAELLPPEYRGVYASSPALQADEEALEHRAAPPQAAPELGH